MASPLAGDLLTVASSFCFAASNVTVARGARPDAADNGAFVSLLITTAIAAAGWLLVGLVHGVQPVTPRALAWFAGAGVFTAFVGRVFFYASIERLGAMRSSAMKRLIPFFTVMLGVGVLGERLTPAMGGGMALIAASFAFLVVGGRGRGRGHDSRNAPRPNWGYLYGPVSALGYAMGYLLRKLGLADAHDALLGAAVGCLAGALLFLATAAVSPRYAAAVRATFTHPNAWLLAAGVLSSFGQILYFSALNLNPMSRVALVASMEVFITLVMAVAFLRRSEALTVPVFAAAALGVAGTALIMAEGG
jgi:drug/metabolite transporter (DMT)-like permease